MAEYLVVLTVTTLNLVGIPAGDTNMVAKNMPTYLPRRCKRWV